MTNILNNPQENTLTQQPIKLATASRQLGVNESNTNDSFENFQNRENGKIESNINNQHDANPQLQNDPLEDDFPLFSDFEYSDSEEFSLQKALKEADPYLEYSMIVAY